MTTFKKGRELDVEIEKLAYGGQALSRVDGFVVFVDGALPGQRARVRISRKKRNHAEAQLLEVLRQTPDYREPFCEHFGVCGGCRWQDLAYERQLYWKRRHVLECLQHVEGVAEEVVSDAVPSPQVTGYRNKMEYTFSDQRWLSPEEIAAQEVVYDRCFALGLHVRGFFDRVFNVNRCHLPVPESMEILRFIREWCRESGLPAYSIRNHRGFWRFLVLRDGKRTGQMLAHLITGDVPGGASAVDALAETLRARFPALSTVVHSVNTSRAQVAGGPVSRTCFGPGFIEERLEDLTFRISAHSFFQTNPLGAEALYRTVREFAGLTGVETVWDLYCGTGSIALFLARRARAVAGFEAVAEAVEDAYRNCALNGIENCRFRVGDLKDVIGQASDAPAGLGRPDVVVTDPPRAGMHPKVTAALLQLAPRRIVAVSCNPSTLARDLSLLQERYRIMEVRPFDLFPHTPHVECVVRLERKG